MRCIQELDTSGARAAETFRHGGERYLVVPQLARDVAGQPPTMTLGDSDIPTLVFRWQGGGFVPHAELPAPGGEDAEFFRIGERAFLATASLRTGSGPYDLNADSILFELQDGRFAEAQRFPTFAAKQWRHFTLDGRHFLALAQGVTMPDELARCDPASMLFEWDGAAFRHFQSLDSAWGYNWHFFAHAGQHFLAYADHVKPSRLLRWNGSAFEPFQEFAGQAGRAFCFFTAQGAAWLAFACLLGDTTLHRWDGSRFAPHQRVAGPGGRELHWLADRQRLLLVNFIQGSREEPKTDLQSHWLRFEGAQLVVDASFATLGATDAAVFSEGGADYLVVSNSLSAGIRFRAPTRVYRLEQP